MWLEYAAYLEAGRDSGSLIRPRLKREKAEEPAEAKANTLQ